MGDPGNPTDPGATSGSEPDPDQPGWASPNPPPPPVNPPAEPTGPPAGTPPPFTPPPVPPQPPSAPSWGTPPPGWGTPPAGGTVPPGAVPPVPVPPAAAGWNQPPAAAPKKRRLTWLWILIPTLLVFLVATVVVIVFAVKLVAKPIDTTNDYYSALKSGQYDDAYNELCSPLQSRYSEQDFADLQRSDARTKGRVTGYDFHEFHIENGDSTVTGQVSRGSTDYDTTVGLRKESGDWKICSIRER